MDTGPGRQMSEKVAGSALLTLVFLFWVVLVGLLVGNVVTVLVLQGAGISLEALQGPVTEGLGRSSRDTLRLATLLTHACSFALPVLALALWLYPGRWREELFLRRRPNLLVLLLGILFLVASFPLAQYIYWWNMQIPLPDTLAQMERSANDLVKAFMVMDDPWELLLNLLTVGLVAAFGEELVFRGMVQPKLEKLLGNDMAALWVSALVFSAIHFQFAGFLPRVLLGAVLGYLFYWTRNLWVPVVGHFLFNGLQILAQFFFKEQMEQLDPERMQQPHWASAVIPLALLILLGRELIKRKTSLQIWPSKDSGQDL